MTKSAFLFYNRRSKGRKRRKSTMSGSLWLYYDCFKNEKTSVTEQARAVIQMQIFLPPSPQKQKNHTEWFPSKMLVQMTEIILPTDRLKYWPCKLPVWVDSWICKDFQDSFLHNWNPITNVLWRYFLPPYLQSL